MIAPAQPAPAGERGQRPTVGPQVRRVSAASGTVPRVELRAVLGRAVLDVGAGAALLQAPAVAAAGEALDKPRGGVRFRGVGHRREGRSA
jgi:hypothetical protein